jgi:hypothetical protein
MTARGHGAARLSRSDCTPLPSRQPRGARAGYVLPLTLLLLAVAAASLAGVCRASFQKAVQAANARDDLQRRWAVTSCRKALLPKAPRVLATLGPASGSLSEVRLDVAIGGLPIELVFGDEQAKVKVDVLYREGGRAGAERGVRELALSALTDGGGGVGVALRPRALRGTFEGGEMFEPGDDAALFASWSQVFGDTPPRELVARRREGRSAVADLTCWGDGTVNFRRASLAALRHACPRALGAAGAARLVSLRTKDPEIALFDALEELDLTEEQLEQAGERLTDESTCHSLWIIARSGGRAWYDLSVADESAEAGTGDGAALTFSW